MLHCLYLSFYGEILRHIPSNHSAESLGKAVTFLNVQNSNMLAFHPSVLLED